ncbi:MAG: hypothetical protein JW882_01070 [Deltaproteobacteria bacterium]|nr:hypothetical protein [Deltaproteobacteria bacterium]
MVLIPVNLGRERGVSSEGAMAKPFWTAFDANLLAVLVTSIIIYVIHRFE